MNESAEQALAAAFEAFLGPSDATIHPMAFLQWVRANQPDMLAEVSEQEILAFAGKYFSTPLRTASDAPPLRPDVSRRR